MCGARIGCIVSKKQRTNGCCNEICKARLSPPTFAQVASEAALTHSKLF
jgi:aspartate aminotransferase